MDDVQQLFKNKKYEFIQENIITGILVPARDSNQANIMLISSDFSIGNQITSMSGMSSRISIFPFPIIGEGQIKEYFNTNLLSFQKINKLISFECLLEFYKGFNGDLRSLNRFIREYQGNYQGIYFEE